MKHYEIGGSWFRTLHQPNPYTFAVLIAIGLVLELVVHLWMGISIVYTQFFYLVIVVAGLWYGRRAIWIALFFGILHVGVTWVVLGAVSADAVMRAAMFCIVAAIIGMIVEQMNCYRDLLEKQNLELKETNSRLDASQKSFETANKKLKLLSSITRHDIKNQLLALRGFIELSKAKAANPDLQHFIEREETSARNIQRQIEFTKDYEDIGVHAPVWQNIGMLARDLQPANPDLAIDVTASVDRLEILADPLLEKVFGNLVDNSRRHGERVKRITFSAVHQDGSLTVVYEDDGTGVPPADKERIFEKGFGKHTGLGLFLSREILAITGLSIRETGDFGKGARFRITVPAGKFRSV